MRYWSAMQKCKSCKRLRHREGGPISSGCAGCSMLLLLTVYFSHLLALGKELHSSAWWKGHEQIIAPAGGRRTLRVVELTAELTAYWFNDKDGKNENEKRERLHWILASFASCLCMLLLGAFVAWPFDLPHGTWSQLIKTPTGYHRLPTTNCRS